MGMNDLDPIDRRILDELQTDGRLPMNELAERVGLSTSPCWRRVKQLESEGYIRRYVALLDPIRIGIGLQVFVYVSLDLHQADAFERAIHDRPEVVDCYAMTGEQDYLLRVMMADVEAFEHFLRTELVRMPGVIRCNTSFALKTVKQTTALPLR